MTESEFLQRLDHLMTESNEIHRESREVHRESRKAREDDREFIREMTVRQQCATDQLVMQLRANTSRIEAGTAELIAGRSVLDDIGVAVRQHTQALAKVLDRLN